MQRRDRSRQRRQGHARRGEPGLRALSRRSSLLGLGAALAACGGTPCGPDRGYVSQVVDGDTIQLEDGRKVRYLLVDAPESTKSPVECGGLEAKRFNASLVDGREVVLAFDPGVGDDPSRCTDRFGRLLAYVSVGGVEVNTRLLTERHACVFSLPPAGESRREEFEALELAARNEGDGVWACSPLTCGDE